MVEVQWDVYMQFGRHICSVTYVNNVKCIHTCAFGHIIDCIEFL